ncbi:MAG TPA: GldG family protein [Verrucomicrobiae bacterium]|nr:GldG family protein [Verrucomicrobiae bacterium]
MANEASRSGKLPTLRHRRVVVGANVLVQIGALLAAVVMVNWLASRHYVRFDWTKAGYYQLAGKTKQVLASLKDPVDLIVFLPPAGDHQHEYVAKTLDDVHNLLKEFKFYGKEKLHVEYVDPQRDLARAQQLVKQYNLDSPDVIIFASRGHHKYVRLDEMVDLGAQSQEMGESRVKAFRGEGLFLSAIQTVTEEESPKVYFLTGHGERDPEDFDQREGYSELSRYIKRDNILVEKWNLLESQALPTDAGAIVIAGPRKAFAPSELNALEQYLKGKGRLIIMLDAHTQTGLEVFLKRWGVQVDDDLAMRQAGVLLGTQMLDVNAVAADYAPHPITAKLADTNTEFPYARSIRRAPQPESGTPDQPRVTELVKAAPAYWGETDPDTEHAVFDAATDIAGPLPLAVAVETSKPHGVDVDIGVTRLVVVGTSRFVDNSSLGGGNLDFFMNAVNWLLQREQLMAVSPKVPDEFRLDMSPSQQHAVYMLVVGGLPLMVAIIGIVVWLSRRK